MTYIRPGSRVHKILTLLSVVGEFPYCSIHLLGTEHVYKRLISSLCQPHTYCLAGTDRKITTKLLTISGNGKNKTIRIYRKALPILEWMGELDGYLEASDNHKFHGDAYHIDRHHRIAEVTAMIARMNMEIHTDRVPRLCDTSNRRRFLKPTYYPSKVLKEVEKVELTKSSFSRIAGMIFTEDIGYAVYNTRDALMKWSGNGEVKMWAMLAEIAIKNTSFDEINSAILFGESEDIALQTLLESDKSKHQSNRFDTIYQNIYFIPLNNDGVRQFRMLLIPNRKENILSLLFEDSERSYDQGQYEYDGVVDGTPVYVAFDGDIARLIRFRNAVENTDDHPEVICFPHQVAFLRAYLGDRVVIKTIDIEVLENELGIGKEENEEE